MSNLALGPIQIMKFTFFFVESSQLEISWKLLNKKLLASNIFSCPRSITKNYKAIMEEPENVPDWLTTGITYFLPKLRDNKEVRN
jgi:hypothetical protein